VDVYEISMLSVRMLVVVHDIVMSEEEQKILSVDSRDYLQLSFPAVSSNLAQVQYKAE